jgi:hypothetical protein
MMIHLCINSDNEQEYVEDTEADISSETDTWDISEDGADLLKVKVKQSRYRPGVAQSVPGS